MSNLASPVLIAPLGKARLRFFRSPLDGPDFPWHVHDDLAQCLGLPRDLRRHFQRMAARTFADKTRTLATPDGVVSIFPHYVAQALIGAAIETHGVTESFELEYAKAAVAAMNEITRGWPQAAAFEFVLAAAKRHVSGGRS